MSLSPVAAHIRDARFEASLLVFDLDGTLVDSREDIGAALNGAFVAQGLAPMPDSEIAHHVGFGIQPLIDANVAAFGLSAETAETIAQDFQKRYLATLHVRTRLYPGMSRVLEAFASTPKVILTNKSNVFANALVERLGLDRWFVACYGRHSFPTRKPDGGPLVEIAALYRVETARIAMIGDTHVDIAAGKAAGTFTCGVRYGYGRSAEFDTFQPDTIVECPEQLVEVFA